MSKPKYDYSAVVAAYKADPTIADTLPDTLRTLLQLHYIEVVEALNKCAE